MISSFWSWCTLVSSNYNWYKKKIKNITKLVEINEKFTGRKITICVELGCHSTLLLRINQIISGCSDTYRLVFRTRLRNCKKIYRLSVSGADEMTQPRYFRRVFPQSIFAGILPQGTTSTLHGSYSMSPKTSVHKHSALTWKVPKCSREVKLH